MTSFDLTQIDTLLSTTRAVRRRLDLERPVSLDVVRDCLQLAIQAPTGGSAEQWRWLVVAEPRLKQAVADLYREATDTVFEQAQAAATSEAASKAYAGARLLAGLLERVPILVFPCVAARAPDVTSHAAAGFYGSIIPAVWSFQLALRSRGLGSTYTTAHLRLEERFADLLGIPAGVTQVAMLPVAYTRGTDFRPADRGRVEDITFLNTWGAAVEEWTAAPERSP